MRLEIQRQQNPLDAAETGHLVFTTLHANSSTSSLTRLLDMDVQKYKLNASVRGVLAQRLLRKFVLGAESKGQFLKLNQLNLISKKYSNNVC